MKTAILIDGSFFIKRYKYINGFEKTDSPSIIAENLIKYCMRHIRRVNTYRERYKLEMTELYRIYYYDARPFDGDSKNPITNKNISFKKTPQFSDRNELLKELSQQRKIALRLGHLKNSSKEWTIRSKYTKPLIKGEMKFTDLNENDIEFQLKQKGVDIRIGLDIATLSFKQQVQQIILIAGDSDFVPVAKFARREGVDIVLDPMLSPIDPELVEHIDGKMTIRNMN